VRNFANGFMAAYLSVIDKSIPLEYFDSLLINPNKSVRVSAILSEHSGSFMTIFNSDSAGIEIHYTALPAQFKVICGLFPAVCEEFRRYSLGGKHRLEDFYRAFDSLPPSWGNSGWLRSKHCISGAEGFVLKSAKLISQSDSNLFIVMQSIIVDSTQTTEDTLLYAELNELAIFNGDTSFCWAMSQLPDIAQLAGISAFGSLVHQHFDKSEFLRRAMINDQAKALAAEITRIEHRRQWDAGFTVEPFRLRALREKLQRMMTANNIDTNYVTEIMTSALVCVEGGKIFWYVGSNRGFSWQWVIVNCVLLLIILVLRLVRTLASKSTSVTSILGRVHYVLGVFVIFVNGWVFQSRVPHNLASNGYILPLLSLAMVGYFWYISQVGQEPVTHRKRVVEKVG
jgi:hypothetical protein